MNKPGESPTPHQWRIKEWFPDLSPQVEEKLRAYMAELIFFNGRMNLISPRTEAEADLTHIADGILGSRIILKSTQQKEIYDIGSGNGVPGIILATLAPDRMVRLIDSDARKVEFLKHCISRLGLKNCFASQTRVEDLGEGVMKCGMGRAFAPISKALLLFRRTAASGCQFFHLKGDSWATEIAEIPSQILASWEPKHVVDYTLPIGNQKFTVVLTLRK